MLALLVPGVGMGGSDSGDEEAAAVCPYRPVRRDDPAASRPRRNDEGNNDYRPRKDECR